MTLIREYKVRKSGLRGHTIALPTTWIEGQGINVSDVLRIYEHEGNLLIAPRKMADRAPCAPEPQS